MKDNQNLRMSLIERTGLTFDSFLDREFSSRFYQEEFLNGICARRAEVHARLSKSGGAAFILATVLAFFDLLTGEISYGGVTVTITSDLMPIVAVIAASALLSSVYAFLDDQIIFRILLKLGARIDVQNFPLLLIDKFALNLWGDAITPRVFGPKSGRFQKFVVGTVALVVAIAVILFFLYPILMILKVSWSTVHSDARFAAQAAGVLAAVMVLWTLVTAVVFSVKFTFTPADWHESTSTPTDDFARRMREQIAGSEADSKEPEGARRV